MSNIIELMKTRRSIRKFKPDMVPQSIIEQIMEAGTYAATGRNLQSPIIIEVTDPQTIEKLRTLNREIGGFPENVDPFYGAPVVLIVLADKNCRTRVYDGSLVMGNMMLAAHELGIGSCWIHRAKEEFETEYGRQLLKTLGIQGEYEGIGHCILGYTDGEYPDIPVRKENWIYKI